MERIKQYSKVNPFYKVTYKDGNVKRTFIGKIIKKDKFKGILAWTFIKVDKEECEWTETKDKKRNIVATKNIFIISDKDLVSMHHMKMNLHYGELEVVRKIK